MDPRAEFNRLLAELLALHHQERELMQTLRHEEHLECVNRKFQVALDAEAAFASSGGSPGPAELRLISEIKAAAEANFDIAKKMMEQSKGKIDFIRKSISISYGRDGKMSQPQLTGGMFSGRT